MLRSVVKKIHSQAKYIHNSVINNLPITSDQTNKDSTMPGQIERRAHPIHLNGKYYYSFFILTLNFNSFLIVKMVFCN